MYVLLYEGKSKWSYGPSCPVDFPLKYIHSITPACPWTAWRMLLLSSDAVALPGFCNRGGGDVWVYRGSRVRSPPVPVVLSVYQRGSLLDGLAMYLSYVIRISSMTMKAHTYYIIFGRPHIGGSFPPSPPGGATDLTCKSNQPRMSSSPHRVQTTTSFDVERKKREISQQWRGN